MSIMIREYLGFQNFSSVQDKMPMSLTESATKGLSYRNALIVDIEGIHVGATRNFTRYMKEALKSSMKSWTRPYEKPLIMHHNEVDGKTIGRIINVEYITKDTLSGTDALLFTASVPDKEGAEQIKDGRLLTTSIGIIAHDVRCSCCGYQITDERVGCPDHDRGGVYDNEYCYWDIYDMEAKELSYVIVPSDLYAKNVKIYDEQKAPLKLAESFEQNKGGTTKMTIEELQAANATLTTELETQAVALQEAKQEAETLRAEKEGLSAEKESLTVELTEAKEKIEAKKVELAEKETELSTEVSLREAAESQIISLKESEKTELVGKYANLRKLTGKAELSEAAIATRSLDSLKDSINDLQIELSEGSKGSGIGTIPPVITDPSITESKDEIVKKEKLASNINLEEALFGVFSSQASRFGK